MESMASITTDTIGHTTVVKTVSSVAQAIVVTVTDGGSEDQAGSESDEYLFRSIKILDFNHLIRLIKLTLYTKLKTC